MEARIKKAYDCEEHQPSQWHLTAVRLIRSQLYATQPRIACSFCQRVMDPLSDEWYTKNKYPGSGIFCEDCLGDDQFTVQTLKPEALRRYVLYQAIHLGRHKQIMDGPSYTLTLPPKDVDPKDYVPKKRAAPVPISAEQKAKIKAKMLEIGPDTLPGLEVIDRRQAYLESKGYKIDPAYAPSLTICGHDSEELCRESCRGCVQIN